MNDLHIPAYGELAPYPTEDAYNAACAALEEHRKRADATEAKLKDALRIIGDLIDSDDCWFDHHGGCQAHGYLSLEPGEKCPQQEAKELVESLAEATGRTDMSSDVGDRCFPPDPPLPSPSPPDPDFDPADWIVGR